MTPFSDSNRTVLLRELRLRMPVSRVELSKRTGISKPAVTRGVGDLIAEGLVLEARLGTAGRHGGRRPTLLELNPLAAAGVGCMVGIGELMGCIAGFNGESEHYETVHFDPLADADTVVGQMVRLLQLLIAKNRPGRPLLGLGVSVPGLVDVEGRIVTTPHMPGLRDVELSKLLEERLGLAAYVESESRVQAIAEGWFGHGRGVDNFVCLEAGAENSAGIVINGELWRGAHSLAGEVGHTTTGVNRDRCYCDSQGCWEMVASTTHLLNNIKTSSIARGRQSLYHDGELTMSRIVAAANAGDEVVLREIDVHADALAMGICNLVLAYDPERIILHGESILLGQRLVEMLRTRVSERLRPWLDYEAPIMLTELGTEGALAGAVSLALHGGWGFRDPTVATGGALIGPPDSPASPPR